MLYVSNSITPPTRLASRQMGLLERLVQLEVRLAELAAGRRRTLDRVKIMQEQQLGRPWHFNVPSEIAQYAPFYNLKGDNLIASTLVQACTNRLSRVDFAVAADIQVGRIQSDFCHLIVLDADLAQSFLRFHPKRGAPCVVIPTTTPSSSLRQSTPSLSKSRRDTKQFFLASGAHSYCDTLKSFLSVVTDLCK